MSMIPTCTQNRTVFQKKRNQQISGPRRARLTGLLTVRSLTRSGDDERWRSRDIDRESKGQDTWNKEERPVMKGQSTITVSFSSSCT